MYHLYTALQQVGPRIEYVELICKREIMRSPWAISMISVFQIIFSRTSKFCFPIFDSMTIKSAQGWLLWNYWPGYCWSFTHSVHLTVCIDTAAWGGESYANLPANCRHPSTSSSPVYYKLLLQRPPVCLALHMPVLSPNVHLGSVHLK